MDIANSKPSYPLPLEFLLREIEYTVVGGSHSKTVNGLEIESVLSDSREVKAGALFVAIRGAEYDGHDYVAAALANGCAAVICEIGRIHPDTLGDWTGILVEVEDSSKAYGLVAANYYGRPADQLTFIGITGTNGKTTVTYLLEAVLLHAGQKVGVIGTVNNRYFGDSGETVVLPTQLTTPEAMMLQKVLREMADSGVRYVIMEVSSHGLAQNRISNICFTVAAFTNLSRDHLDYHTSMEEYFFEKTKLFTEHMVKGSIAVLPADPAGKEEFPWHAPLVEKCRDHCAKIIYWGDEENADIRLLGFDLKLNQTQLEIQTDGNEITLRSQLIGRFNIDNILTAFGLCSALKLNLNTVAEGLRKAGGAPGRLERVVDSMDEPLDGPVVLVDYAHTPDALEQVLSTVASLPHGELYCVFGCGGDRDGGKRPLMGEIGCRFSDVAIVTDDNPRTENPDEIVNQILAGSTTTGIEQKPVDWLKKRSRGERGVIVERDRRNAIRLAITSAGPEDVVVIAGKGHETYQLSSRGRLFFDDILEAKNVFCSWTSARVAKSVGGKLSSDNQEFRLLGEVLTDSRVAGNDSIFVALKGEKYDGHEFAAQAVENGAVCLVVEKEVVLPPEKNVNQIIVTDTLKALGDMAAYRRAQLAKICNQTVIAITGSCGKTTVKEMVAAILQRKWVVGPDHQEDCVLKTHGNFNNLIGLPLSLLPLSLTNCAAVLEVGMNQAGELRRLSEIVDPDISCIVNIYGAHLEGLQSIDGVAKAKEELFEGTKKSGTLIVNLDDPRVSSLAEKYEQTKITFTVLEENLQKNPDMWVTDVEFEETGSITFTLHSGMEKEDIHLFAAGEHNVSNALAAAAISYGAGANIQEIAAGLADFRPADKRMEILQAKGGYRLLNDTYNANPASMAAGLKTLKQMAGQYRVAILGDMLELGETSEEAHFELGRLVAQLDIDDVGFIGEFKDNAGKGALSGGLDSENIRSFDEKVEAINWVNELVRRKKLGQDGLLLVKASRGLRFETIVSGLVP
jgi:murE/murF fusion protein